MDQACCQAPGMPIRMLWAAPFITNPPAAQREMSMESSAEPSWVTLCRAFHTTCLVWDFPPAELSYMGDLVSSSSERSHPRPRAHQRCPFHICHVGAATEPLCSQLKKPHAISAGILARWPHIFLPQGLLSNMYVKDEAEHTFNWISPIGNQGLIRFPEMQGV